MKTIPVELCGPTYKDRAGQLSSQKTQNMYLGPGLETKWVAYDFPGLKSAIARAGTDRGMYVFNERLYQVSGQRLLLVAENGEVTDLGVVTGDNRCIFDDDGIKLFIATGNTLFVYDGSSVTPVVSAALETPNSVSYLNGYFLYDGDDGRFQASDAGDGTTINDLSVGIANSNGDPILRGFVQDQLVYWAGPRSFEPWYFSGEGDLPFDRLEQGFIKLGLGAIYSLASNVEAMFFLGHDRQFYQLARSVAMPISTPSISNEVERFTTVSDAVGWMLTFQSQKFYWVNFPTESRSFLYSVTYGYWVDLSYGMHGARHLANSYAFCYGKHFVADYRNGNIYELDINTYTDVGAPRLRFRETAPITAGGLGFSGNRVIVGRLQASMNMGGGLAVGQGVNPLMMFRISGDGGKTFGAENLVDIGVMGEYDKRIDCNLFADGYSIVYRLSYTDPTFFSLFGGFIDVEDGGF